MQADSLRKCQERLQQEIKLKTEAERKVTHLTKQVVALAILKAVAESLSPRLESWFKCAPDGCWSHRFIEVKFRFLI
jgi:hypothetical protein